MEWCTILQDIRVVLEVMEHGSSTEKREAQQALSSFLRLVDQESPKEVHDLAQTVAESLKGLDSAPLNLAVAK